MIQILLQLLIIAIILGFIVWAVGFIPGIGPFVQIVRGAAIVIFVVYVIYVLMGFVGGMHVLPR